MIKRESAEVSANGNGKDAVFIVFNRDAEGAEVTLPPTPHGLSWRLELDTAAAEPFPGSLQSLRTVISGNSVLLFALEAANGAP